MENMAREISVILILACMATLVLPGQARPRPQMLRWPPIIPPPTLDPEIRACWSALESVEGCVHEIVSSFFRDQFLLSRACCKAIDGLSANCWPKMLSPFPNDPLFPPSLLKSFCDSLGGPAPTPREQVVAPSPYEGDALSPDDGEGAPSPNGVAQSLDEGDGAPGPYGVSLSPGGGEDGPSPDGVALPPGAPCTEGVAQSPDEGDAPNSYEGFFY